MLVCDILLIIVKRVLLRQTYSSLHGAASPKLLFSLTSNSFLEGLLIPIRFVFPVPPIQLLLFMIFFRSKVYRTSKSIQHTNVMCNAGDRIQADGTIRRGFVFRGRQFSGCRCDKDRARMLCRYQGFFAVPSTLYRCYLMCSFCFEKVFRNENKQRRIHEFC